MDLKQAVQNIIDDTAVELTQQFDRNFERKAFFDRKWKENKVPNSRGSLMLRSGDLRRSVNKSQSGSEIRWRSSLPYASIHNEGGDITVTKKMKSFFWAMFYKANGAAKSGKGGKKRIENLSGEAAKWKALALMPVGKIMTVEQRQFIGWHPQVDKSIKMIVDHNMKEVNKTIKKNLSNGNNNQ